MLTIGSERPLFDIPAGIAYFNTAYNSPLLNTSRTALVRAAQAKSHPWERPSARLDPVAIGRACRLAGATFVLDATQD